MQSATETLMAKLLNILWNPCTVYMMTFDLSRDPVVLERSKRVGEILQNYDKGVVFEKPWPNYLCSQWLSLSSRGTDVRKETCCLLVFTHMCVYYF